MKRIIVIVLTLSAFKAHGFGGDAAIIGQLTSILAEAQALYKTATDTLDISERIEEYQAIKAARTLTQEAAEFRKSVVAAQQLYNDVNKFIDDPLSSKSLENDISNYKRKLKAIKKLKGSQRAKEYADVFASLRNIELIQRVNNSNKERLAIGANDSDKLGVLARNSQMLAEMEIKKQRAEINKKSINDTLIDHVFSGSYPTTTILSD